MAHESTMMAGSMLPPLPQMQSISAEPFSRSGGQLDDRSAEEDLEDDRQDDPPREVIPEGEYDSRKARLVSWIEDHNIARHLSWEQLQTIGREVVEGYQIDENSRAEWKEEAKKALDFATQDAQPKQYPWPKASNIIFPLITQAALQFAAKAYPAMVPNRNVVKGIIWGEDDGTPATQTGDVGGAPIIDPNTQQPQWLIPPGAKQKIATRTGEHMSYQLLVEMPEWEPQTDAMLHQLPIVGGSVRKTYFDYSEKRNVSVRVPLMNLVWNKNAPSFEAAPRHTEIIELYPHEIITKERADETFLPLNYGPGDSDDDDPSDTQAKQVYLEQHTRYDLDGDGYPEPLIITVHKRSARVVRIVARYDEDGIHETNYEDDEEEEIERIEPLDYYTLYPFLPDPKGGSYPVGFGHLLKPMNEAINTTINQMFDAGHLQIAGGGFIGTSLSIPSGPTTFRLGEYIPVNNKGQSIRDAVFPIPFPGPSATLFQLLGFLVGAAEKTAAVQDVLTGDTANLSQVQPTTMLALIEQGMKVYTAIYKRIYRAFKSELAKLYRLNKINLADKKRFTVGDQVMEITPADYRLGGGVEPVADPTMVTDMQKLARAGVLFQFKDDPLFNPLEVRRRYLDACGIEGIDKILVPKMPPPVAAQMEMQLKQAELGKARSDEQKNLAQAMLFMSQARSSATEPEMEWLEKQLTMMRLHIEALNTTVKAADVDAKFHGHNVRLKQTAAKANEVAHSEPAPRPIASQLPPQPPGGPDNGSGIPAMAPPPNNGNGSPFPPPPSPELAPSGNGAV